MVALNLVKQANKRRQIPDQVSELTTNRLSIYLRCLNTLDASGVQTISSQALAERFHLNAAQIRKDLAYFGEFGVRGVGYYVKELRRHLRQILGLDRKLRESAACDSERPHTFWSRQRLSILQKTIGTARQRPLLTRVTWSAAAALLILLCGSLAYRRQQVETAGVGEHPHDAHPDEGEAEDESLGGRQLGGRMLRACLEDPHLGVRERDFLVELRPAFSAVLETPEQAFYVGGTAGVLGEFRPDELAGYQRLLEVLEQRAMALELMRASLVSKRPFVRVGSELADPQLASVSLVGAPYGLQHRNLGTVSLIGPMRMDYVKAIDAVRTAARELSRFVEDLYES